jgi:hypothetical protein
MKVIKESCARINKLEKKSDNKAYKAVFEILKTKQMLKNIKIKKFYLF